MMIPMLIVYGAYTHKGKVRKRNEDYFYIPNKTKGVEDIAMVADGMGGHNAGDLASRMVVEHILEYFYQHKNNIKSIDDVRDAIHQAMQNANQKVYEYSITDAMYSGMGTTLTLAYFFEDTVCIGHVGDSRGYIIREGELKQITKDHSLVQELLENGSITPDEMQHHPQKNVITRALGTDKHVRIDYYEVKMQPNDALILCTDGLLNHVNIEDKIEFIMSNRLPQHIAEKLGKKALDGGGIDNITVVVAKYLNGAEKR